LFSDWMRMFRGSMCFCHIMRRPAGTGNPSFSATL
jgi:hypothetical protein